MLSSCVEERRVTDMRGRRPLHNGLIQTHSTPLCFFPSPIISLSLHHLLPSISSLHLPDSRSSSSMCRRSHLFSLDMAFYLRSNSHHFNRDKITLRWAPVPAGLPARVCVCVCLYYVCVCDRVCLLAHGAYCCLNMSYVCLYVIALL